MDFDAYLAFKLAAVGVYIFFGGWALVRKKFPAPYAYGLTTLSVLTGFVASRLWFMCQHYFEGSFYEATDFLTAWNEAGSVLYGWTLGGFLAAVILARFWKWPALRVTDTLFPWVLVSQILNRLGCFAGECCWGKPLEAFWAVFNESEGARLHPVQLYEALWDAALIVVLWRFSKNKEGRATFLYFVGYAAGRFALEYFRGDNQPALWGMTVPQLTSLIIVICAILLFQSKKQRSVH